MSQVEIFDGKRAENYENFVDTWIPNYRYFISKITALLSKTKNKKLLVVGCGTGNEILAFENELQQWQITGVDPSTEMLKKAHQKLNAFPNVNLIKGTTDNLPEEKTFGAATLLLVLHFFKDDGTKLELLKSIAKRLEPGAAFIMLDITGDPKQIKQNLDILELLLDKNITQEEIQKRIYRIQNELQPVSEERLKTLFEQSGFEPPTRFFQSSIYMGWFSRKI